MTLLFLGMAVLGYAIFKLSSEKSGVRVSKDYIKFDTSFGVFIGVTLILQSLLDYYLKSDDKYILKAIIYAVNFTILYIVSRINNLIYIIEAEGTKMRKGWLFLAIILVLPSIVATLLI